MPDINVKGTIVSNDDKWIYDLFAIDAVCPKDISKQLEKANGQDVTIQINSGGGDVFAGNEIYYHINSYKGRKTVDIVGLAASAATIIACAGDVVRAVPGAQYMIHNVSTFQSGDYRDMDHASDILKTANKSISNIYQMKTGKSEKELLKLMDEETWMDSTKAKEYGFVDEIIGEGDNGSSSRPLSIYNSTAMILSDETKEKVRNLIKNPGSTELEELKKEQENLNLLKLKGGFRNEV